MKITTTGIDLAKNVFQIHGRPRFAKLSIDDGSKVKIAPVHSVSC